MGALRPLNCCSAWEKDMPPIPPVLGWTAIAVAAVALTRTLVREWTRVNDRLRAQQVRSGSELGRETYPTLRRDPRTGIYRPE